MWLTVAFWLLDFLGDFFPPYFRLPIYFLGGFFLWGIFDSTLNFSGTIGELYLLVGFPT